MHNIAGREHKVVNMLPCCECIAQMGSSIHAAAAFMHCCYHHPPCKNVVVEQNYVI